MDEQGPNNPASALTGDQPLERALGGAEEQHRLLMECVTDYAIFFLEPHGKVATWNTGAERIFGYQESEIVGQHYSCFFTPEDVRAGQPDKEFVLLSIEWPPDSIGPLHSHPGDEYGIVVRGVYAVRELNGQWKTYTAGQGFHIPRGVVHEDKNMVPSSSTIHSYVVDKGKTLIEPYTKH